jgi:RIP metalloprotease rseP
MTAVVAFHELGHLVVALMFGIRVTQYSIGFGKVLFSCSWRGTRYCLSLIPLGGYVRMLDTRKDRLLSAQEQLYAFDRQHPCKKILVYLAGPFANLLLAVFLLSAVVYHEGVITVAPIVHTVIPDSLADKAGFQEGDHVLMVDGQPVSDFEDLNELSIDGLSSLQLSFTVQDARGKIRNRRMYLRNYPDLVDEIYRGKASFGFSPDCFSTEIDEVLQGLPAAEAGLKSGDRIVGLANKKINNYQQFITIARHLPLSAVSVDYVREGRRYQTFLKPKLIGKKQSGALITRIGITNKIDSSLAKRSRAIYHATLAQSFLIGFKKTFHVAKRTVVLLGKMLVGQSSLKTLSGPITIASMTKKTVDLGWTSYLFFLAMISISIGILNLLPISVLDGGGALMSLIEWVQGKPLSLRAEDFALRIGFAMLMLLIFVALFNDFFRIFAK